MDFVNISKKNEGRFICRYDIEYKTALGNTKMYEMISRDKDLKTFEELTKIKTDAVVLVIHNKDKSKILLNREFRLAVGKFVYNFPAGLVDAGESFEVAAKRELWEETGLDLVEITDVWPVSYSAVGVTNETSVVVEGIAEGEFRPSTSDEEEIEAGWFTKEEVRELMKNEPFASRTQAYCVMWARD